MTTMMMMMMLMMMKMMVVVVIAQLRKLGLDRADASVRRSSYNENRVGMYIVAIDEG